jgi:hypothetical protein
MSEDSSAGRSIGPVTAEAMRLFDRAPQRTEILREVIQSYSPKKSTQVVDVLILAYLRHLLAILNPPLPPAEATISIRIWDYWETNAKEFRRLCELGILIADYLGPEGFKKEVAKLAKKHIIEKVLPRELIVDYWPELEKVFATSGPRVTLRPIATRALQMKMDGMTWREIADKICSCKEQQHGENCRENIRHSVIALQKFLVKLGIELP